MEIYFDNAATTRLRDEVINEMTDCLINNYGNPSSVYKIARNSKKRIDKARETVAASINADHSEIYFTSCGTESNNWAIKGVCEAYADKGKHIITSKIEHHSVLHVCEYMAKNGYEVTYLDVDENGIVLLSELEKAIKPTTILISVMCANNEIGTIQPIKKIGEIAKNHGIIFHTDAVQAFGHVPMDIKELNIDLLTASAHKLYAAKGTGVLYIKKGIKIKPFMLGGAQERSKRAGTENTIGIAGFAKAIECAMLEMNDEADKIIRLRDKIIDGILSTIPHAKLNGHKTNRLPGNINISFNYIEGESILLMLDMKGIYASSGSACTSGSLDPSHVLLALGLPHEMAHGSLRITLGRYNTEEEADILLKELPPIVQRLREMSPLYEMKNR